MNQSTIVAIATAPGKGGIGIIKISGSEAISIATDIFQPAKSILASNFTNNTIEFAESHQLYYGNIVDPHDRRILDEVLLSVMKAPRTYTCEDVVEINAHGGPVAVHAIIDLVLKKGARLAQPGEFTKRAFLNGRIDLTQAEGIIDIINARTDKSLRAATAQVDGHLKSEIESIRNALVDLMTRNEAAIDFPEDVEEIGDPKTLIPGLRKNVVDPLKHLLRQHKDGKIIKDGVRIAIVGRPNVGKSSLLNRLLQKDRAIVTSIPGTTRDIIEETLNIQGVPVIISDTAGLHSSDDPVENIGMEKTLDHLDDCDLVLLLIEANNPLTPADRKIYEHVHLKPKIIVLNKIDLLGDQKRADIPKQWSANDCVDISALYGDGLALLKERIISVITGKNPIEIEEEIIPNLRHKNLLDESLASARDIVKGFEDGISPELSAISIQEAVDSLGEILGENVRVDVLDRIFSEFCIGK